MIEIKKGVTYELDNYFHTNTPRQKIHFVELRQDGDSWVAEDNGTTLREVLAVVLDRLNFLEKKSPSIDNSIMLSLTYCLSLLETQRINENLRDNSKDKFIL